MSLLRTPTDGLNGNSMTKILEELIERSLDLKCFLKVSSFELHHYEDGSYSDFHVQKVVDLDGLIKLTGGLELKIFHDTTSIIVRLFERE